MIKQNIELLAPAGSFEAMQAAVQNGANAVYLSGKKFGARAFAANFDNDELKRTVEYCHLRDVKVYVTVNTLYYDEQFVELEEYLQYLASINIDAIIVQDIGLMNILRNDYPDMEIHMSTQTSVHTLEGVKYFESLGVQRVVLARENSIDEIKKICANTNIDIEVFVHGALCVSCSGQCLMSSMIAKRSGNRGECGQTCRLSYSLKEDLRIISKNDYLLSPRDLCSIENVGQLIEAGIYSFKIEGRMKSPSYVASVTKQYRKAIDSYLENKKINYDEAINEMKQMFNRGFTGGFLFKDTSDFITHKYSGNIGTLVGEAVKYHFKQKSLLIKLSDTLYQQDRITFENKDFLRTITKLYLNGQLVNKASAGDFVEIALDKPINEGSKIYKINDYNLSKQLASSINNNDIKKSITMKFVAKANKCPVLSVICDNEQFTVTGINVVQEASKQPASVDSIKKQLNKLGNTTFKADEIEIDIDDNIFMSNKELNELRREVISKVEDWIINHKQTIKHQETVIESKEHYIKNIDIKINNLEQIKDINFKDINRVYIPLENDYSLYFDKLVKYDVEIIPYTNFWPNIDVIKLFIQSEYYNQVTSVMVSNYGAIEYFKDKNCILNYNFNLCNQKSISHFNNEVILSLEMSKKQINKLKVNNELTQVVYSKVKCMNLRHCVISNHYFNQKKEHCNLCKQHKYSLIDRKGISFDIITDDNCNNYILNSRPLVISDIQRLKVDRILLEFHNENNDEISKCIEYYGNLKKDKKGLDNIFIDKTKGYF